MSANQKEDVNDVLDDVIVKINRITDHVSLPARLMLLLGITDNRSFEVQAKTKQPIASLTR